MTAPALDFSDLEPDAWRAYAACHGEETNKFFPRRGMPEEPAKRVCNGSPAWPRAGRPPCPVRAECLEYALSMFLKEGVFGGLSERERRQERRRRYLANGGVDRKKVTDKMRVKLARLEEYRASVADAA